MAEKLTLEQKRALSIASAKVRLQRNQGQGPTIDNAVAQEEKRIAEGVSGERFPDVEPLMTANARAAGAPAGMVYDSRTGQMVDTAAMAERMGQGASATALMAIPFAGEFVDQAMGGLRELQTGENPQIAAETMRQSRGKFREDHPVGAPALEIGSGILAAAPMLAAAGAGGVASTAGLGTKIATSAALGGGIGAAEGAASGYGAADYGGRAEAAKSGAMFGGLAGATLGVAGTATAAGLSRAWRKIKAGKAPAAPTTKALRAEKTRAYKAVDAGGFVAPAQEFDNALGRIMRGLDDLNYNPDADKQIRAVLTALENKWGDDISLGQLDRLRQLTWRRVTGSTTKQERALAGVIIDGLDDLTDKIGAGPLMATAREANSRWRKALVFEDAWARTQRQTSGMGSGGNILNKSIQAVNRIIDGRDAKFFSPAELDLMRNFVAGDTARNTLRRIGKVAPGGNGLMAALNLGAVAARPSMIGVTALAAGAKAISDRRAVKGVMGLRDAVASGVIPKAAPGIGLTAPTSAALGAVGSVATRPGPTTAKQRGLELYGSGVTDPNEIKSILTSEGFL